jgi:hypothetical protein
VVSKAKKKPLGQHAIFVVGRFFQIKKDAYLSLILPP